MPDVKHFDPEAVLAQVELLFWRRGAAATGVQDVVAATGLSRSSLYSTFGGKDVLYAAALRRYLERRSRPMFERLAADDRGLPAVAEFFERLVRLRCTGEFAGWGCFVANAHTQMLPESARVVLDEHHRRLREAFTAALKVAASNGQLRAGVRPEAAAELLGLLASAINLRSRSGGSRGELRTAVDAALAGLRNA